MERKVNTIIDKDKCIGCGKCVKVCPSKTISMLDGKAAVTGRSSINCGHCEQICPVDAITVTSLTKLEFNNFEADLTWLPPGQGDVSQLVRLMASRRSCRNFSDCPVDRTMLEDLVKIGTTAPSATNSQDWTFTVLPEREQVIAYGNLVVDFFCKINKLAKNIFVRNTLSFLGQKQLKMFYKKYTPYVDKAVDCWHSGEHDYLFHSAPAVIIIGGKNTASMPDADAQLATQNILLAAHNMGLGSCLIGFAVKAMMNDKKICKAIGGSANEQFYSAIALGWPEEDYKYVCRRKNIVPIYPSL